MEKEKSWYSLTKKETKKLEEEFLKNEVALSENRAMHIQIIVGVTLLVLCTIILSFSVLYSNIDTYLFIILLIGIFLGMTLVVMATIEYHMKFNSWLYVEHKIIKK